MNPFSDLHTHTISSGHAYSTLFENVQEAKRKGLSVLGISDHAPAMEGAPKGIYFRNLKAIPREIEGVRILRGVELNVLNPQGEVDLKEKTLKDLDYRIASIHVSCYGKDHTVEENMAAYQAICENPLVDILGHIDDGRIEVDYEALLTLAKRTHTLVELNNASCTGKGGRLNAHENAKKWLTLAKRIELPIIINSDAHFMSDVGDYKAAEAVLQEVDFPQELVCNANLALFQTYFNLEGDPICKKETY